MGRTKSGKSGRSSYYVPLAIVIIIGAVLALSFTIPALYDRMPQSQNTTRTTTGTPVSNLTEVIPGPFPSSSCPARFYQVYSTMLNATGFSIYNVSGMVDYVIKPGDNGTLIYNVHIGPDLNNMSSNGDTITNWVQFSHATDSNLTSTTHSGINISMEPTTEKFSYNSNYTVTAKITVLQNAEIGTYWASLSPGACFGGPIFLFTVGNAPYGGEVKQVLIA